MTTVIRAVEESFHELPETFSVLNLIDKTRRKLGRPMCTDGNITRRLRDLRANPDKEINYRVVDNQKAIYEKILPEGQLSLKL